MKIDKSKLKTSQEFIVGSRYFFENIKGFSSKDIDILIVEKEPSNYKVFMQISGKNKCVFRWKYMCVESFLHYAFMLKNTPMNVGKFLNKEFAEYIGLEIKHLKRLEPIFKRLDEKHLYEKVIFDSYIENNGFYLTEEQRLKAYEEYKKYRS